MKKKIVTFLITVAMGMTLAACGGNSETSTDTDSSAESTQSESNDTAEDTSDQAENPTLDDLESYLLDKGVLTGEKTQTSAEMIGAISGFKYADSNAEIYEYDENSEDYKTLSEGGSIEIEGMSGYAVSSTAINGKFVLMASSSGDVSQELIDAFNSFE